MYYVYVLRSTKDGNLYVGFTKNLENRLKQHNTGLVDSTKNRNLLNLTYNEAGLNKEDVVKREKYLKTTYGKRYLKNRLKSYFTG